MSGICGNCGLPYQGKEFEHIILKACIIPNAMKKYEKFLKEWENKQGMD